MGSGPITKEVFYMLLLEVIVVFVIGMFMLACGVGYEITKRIRDAEVLVIKVGQNI